MSQFGHEVTVQIIKGGFIQMSEVRFSTFQFQTWTSSCLVPRRVRYPRRSKTTSSSTNQSFIPAKITLTPSRCCPARPPTAASCAKPSMRLTRSSQTSVMCPITFFPEILQVSWLLACEFISVLIIKH